MEPILQKLPIRKLDDASVRTRCNLRADHVLAAIVEYANRVTEGSEPPPIDVFFDGENYVVANGKLTLAALRRVGRTDAECRVHSGNRCAALFFALSTDQGSLPKRWEDRETILTALLRDPEATRYSNVQLARASGFSEPTVRRRRTDICPETVGAERQGRDGRVIKTGRIGRRPEVVSTVDASASTRLGESVDAGATDEDAPASGPRQRTVSPIRKATTREENHPVYTGDLSTLESNARASLKALLAHHADHEEAGKLIVDILVETMHDLPIELARRVLDNHGGHRGDVPKVGAAHLRRGLR